MGENEIERLIREADETGPDTDVSIPESTVRQSFRIVGGIEAAQVTIRATSGTGVTKVATTTIRPGRYLVVAVRDVPAEGYSIAEDGYDANTAKARVEMLLGPCSHLDGSTWAGVVKILDAGGKVVFTRDNVSIDLHGRQVFPVRVVE